MSTLRTPRRPDPGDDAGAALIVILALTAFLSLLVAVSFTVAQRGLRVAAAEEDVHGSLAAAEAGIDDYLFRLNTVDEYWGYDADTPAPDGNSAFSPPSCLADLTTCSFTDIPGPDPTGQFTYVVDAAQLPATGTITLDVLGCTPAPCDVSGATDGRIRHVEVQLRQRSFLDFLYFTDFETLPPLAYPPADRAWVEANCARRQWPTPRPSRGRPSDRSKGCTRINWAQNDVTDGPWHTNDRFLVNGDARWLGTASSSDPTRPPGRQYDLERGATPFFAEGLDHIEPIPLPPSNSQLLADADHRVNGEGCLFTGPTELTLNPGGTVTVRSPNTKRSGPGCGSWPSPQPRSAQTIAIPANGVIYVQPIPADPADENHSRTCRGTGGQGSDNGLGYPYEDDPTEYNCRAGDVFVEGTLGGRLTIGAGNNITITWHLRYADPAAHMLGLISNDLIGVYHPVTRENRQWVNNEAGPRHTSGPFRDPEINAAMLSVRNSFYVQSYGLGVRADGTCDSLGDLSVNGAIAQLYRGPVGTGPAGAGACTGYDKDYTYDARLAFTNPPRFINPVEAQWVVSRFAEQPSPR